MEPGKTAAVYKALMGLTGGRGKIKSDIDRPLGWYDEGQGLLAAAIEGLGLAD